MTVKSDFLDFLKKPLARQPIDTRLADLIGRYPSADVLRHVVPGPLLYERGSARVVRRYDINFALDLSDYPSWSLFYHCAVDSSRGVLQFVNEGDTVLDIGGNIGQTALMLARKIGPTGRVISFEPFPISVSRFETNLMLNPDIANISLERFALGNSEDVVQIIEECASNSGGNSIAVDNGADSSPGFEIEVHILDDYIDDHGLDRIDLIKIDVEGYEMKVLQGAERTLATLKPKLFLEVSDKKLKRKNSSSNELVSFLAQLGYRLQDMTTGKFITSASELKAHTDLYCESVA